MTEKSLSSKINPEQHTFKGVDLRVLMVKDVKEAVKRLKGIFHPDNTWELTGVEIIEKINELFGKELCE